MALRYLFLDESGDLTFSRKGSKYFTLTSIGLDDCRCGNDLIELRRTLAWEQVHLLEEFHATQDLQSVRDRVFATFEGHEFRIDSIIVEKRKTAPHLRSTEQLFYKQVLYLHLKFVIPRTIAPGDQLLVICAALGTRREREKHLENLRDVVRQIQPGGSDVRYAFWPASAEPCLQVADYCSWAIHRKWERGDVRSYDLIANRIASEFDVFSKGKKLYF